MGFFHVFFLKNLATAMEGLKKISELSNPENIPFVEML
jgi:hypothetical protein